ncbi:MAG: hypothetical protein WD066_08450 [Planctomycetaceae bacterium]
MIINENESLILQLRSDREELDLLNRTISHHMTLASNRTLLPDSHRAQHLRRVPSASGVRRDAFFWDSWDWKIRGEDDLRRFFRIARRIGGRLGELAETEAASLLPGDLEEIVGRRNDLFLPDHWLFVVHHLGWCDELPYECELQWKHGGSFDDAEFSVVSHLPANIVQASVDTLTVLIDAALGSSWQPSEDEGAGWKSAHPENSGDGKGATPGIAPLGHSPRAARVRKRAKRAANIELLEQELIQHIRSARDHAQATVEFDRVPDLLPRPTQRDLASRVGITESVASRCFNDRRATRLNLLWETAGDLNAVVRFG